MISDQNRIRTRNDGRLFVASPSLDGPIVADGYWETFGQSPFDPLVSDATPTGPPFVAETMTDSEGAVTRKGTFVAVPIAEFVEGLEFTCAWELVGEDTGHNSWTMRGAVLGFDESGTFEQAGIFAWGLIRDLNIVPSGSEEFSSSAVSVTRANNAINDLDPTGELTWWAGIHVRTFSVSAPPNTHTVVNVPTLLLT